jgi:ATP-dependent DNA ligase
MWFGSLGRLRSRTKSPPVESIGREPPLPDADVAIVIVDLLWIDDEPMLAVPLLERKRILESVLGESRLVRRGIFVRPPIDTWIGSWRSFGFSRVAYKGANSRYTPGATNSQWAIGELPAR